MGNLIGRKIGPYEVQKLLGRGGMAEVYLAYQSTLNRYVAIKVLSEVTAGDEQFLQRFRQEALAAGGLRHPNILPFHDTGTFEGQPYIVMDYVSGGTLSERLNQEGAIAPEVAAGMAAQIADALDYAHRRGIVHRDLKPGNILLDDESRPVLADFGIAQAIGSGPRLTQTGAAIGTPEYMSPEQTQGLRVDGRSDIYSLGIMLYQMLTGNVPFRAATPVATLYQIVNQPPPPPRVYNAGIPPYLESIVLRALAKRPEERFQTGKEMAEALRSRKTVPAQAPGVDPEAAVAVAGQASARPVEVTAPYHRYRPETAPAPAQRGSSRGILIAIVALLVVVLLIGAAYLFLLQNGKGAGQAVANVTASTVNAAPTAAPIEPTTVPTSSPGPPTAAATPIIVQKIVERVVTATPQPTPTEAPPSPSPISTLPSATRVPAEEATVTVTPGSTPLPPTETPAPTATPVATARPTTQPANPNLVADFENFGTWRRGDQPNGTFEQSVDRKHDGKASARLAYDLPGTKDNFVVFRAQPPIPIPGQPDALSMWVYGDGSNAFLNIWVQDSQKPEGQVRQFNLGQITHKDSWQPMTAKLDTGAPWPQQHISGPDSNKLVYPLSLYAVVLDAPNVTTPSQGAIYLDEIVPGALAQAPVAAGTSAPTAFGATPAPAAKPVSGRIVFAQNNQGRQDIMAVDAATGNTWSVHPYGSQPRVRGDGRVLFNGIGGGKNDLITVGLDGGGEQIIGRHPEDVYPDWSPDGTSAVFGSTFGKDHYEKIYIQTNAGTSQDPVPLQISGQDVLGRFPTWLKNWRIAYSGCDYWATGSNCGIWTMNSDGSGQPARLTEVMDDRVTDTAGGRVLLSSQTSGNWDVYVSGENGGGVRNLTQSPSQDFGATFSPDGGSIAFISDRDGWGIWVMNVDGSNPHKLIAVPGGFGSNWADERLSWGP